ASSRPRLPTFPPSLGEILDTYGRWSAVTVQDPRGVQAWIREGCRRGPARGAGARRQVVVPTTASVSSSVPPAPVLVAAAVGARRLRASRCCTYSANLDNAKFTATKISQTTKYVWSGLSRIWT